jgi:C1A family cysteine protease
VNWAGQVTTPIKDQGSCGACWAFAAVEQVESDIMRNFGMNYTYELSQEQLMDCNISPNPPQNACNGGNPNYAFKYMLSSYIEPDSTYPYTSYKNTKDKKCNYQANEGVAGLYTYYRLPRDESCMAKYVQDNGPITIGVNANVWLHYNPSNSGNPVMSAAACGNGPINHAVQVVGVSIPGNYWIVRNTWGTGWGQDGYIYLEYGKNTCNMSAIMNGLFTEPILHTAVPSNTTSSSDSGGNDDLTVIGGVGGLVGIICGAVFAGIFFLSSLVWCFYHVSRPRALSQQGNDMSTKETMQEVI